MSILVKFSKISIWVKFSKGFDFGKNFRKSRFFFHISKIFDFSQLFEKNAILVKIFENYENFRY